MASLGTIGAYYKAKWFGSDCGVNARDVLRCINALSSPSGKMVAGFRDDTVGNPAPSLRMDSKGSFKFTWVVSVARDLYVDVKQSANVSPRPRVTVKANSAIGVNSDVQGSAASSTGWVTIGPISVAPTSEGVLEVYLENLYDAQLRAAPCYWDNITESDTIP